MVTIDILENSTTDVDQFEEDSTATEVQMEACTRKIDNEIACTGTKKSKVEENYQDMRKIVDEILEQAYDASMLVDTNYSKSAKEKGYGKKYKERKTKKFRGNQGGNFRAREAGPFVA